MLFPLPTLGRHGRVATPLGSESSPSSACRTPLMPLILFLGLLWIPTPVLKTGALGENLVSSGSLAGVRLVLAGFLAGVPLGRSLNCHPKVGFVDPSTYS